MDTLWQQFRENPVAARVRCVESGDRKYRVNFALLAQVRMAACMFLVIIIVVVAAAAAVVVVLVVVVVIVIVIVITIAPTAPVVVGVDDEGGTVRRAWS